MTRTHGKVAAFDHTFSAPKSVSLLYAFGDDRVRREVTAAHRRAVAEASDATWRSGAPNPGWECGTGTLRGSPLHHPNPPLGGLRGGGL